MAKTIIITEKQLIDTLSMQFINCNSFVNTLYKYMTASRVLELLENEEVLGIFDENGVSCFSELFTKPDTIVLNVDSNMARLINNLRSQGVFDVTL